MLLPGMNMEEIRREISKDSPLVYRKAGYTAKKLLKNFGPIKDKTITRVFNYYSPCKNNWIYGLRISKTQSQVFMLAHHYTQSGLNAYGVFGDSDYLMHFGKHFFERYNEREGLGCMKRLDIMHAYIQANFLYSFHKRSGFVNEESKMFCITDKGLVLGRQNEKERVIHACTYLPFRLLNRGQFITALKGVEEILESIQYKHEPIITIGNYRNLKC